MTEHGDKTHSSQDESLKSKPKGMTGRKRGDEAVREGDARLQTVLDNVVDGIITIDERGVVQSLSSACSQGGDLQYHRA